MELQNENVYSNVKNILMIARERAYSAVNFAMVEAYWNIGKMIIEAQSGNERSEYGEYLIKYLSEKLSEEFGKGFDTSNLKRMRQFYLTFQKGDALRHQSENLMWRDLGTRADYEKEFGEMPVNKLVRKIVGLDRLAANEAFSEFLNNRNLNTKQMHFINLIVDYIVNNGFIDDNRVLQEDPFRNVGSIIELFKDNMDDARGIMSIVSNIKINAEEVG